MSRGLYENSGCVFFFTWAVSFSFFSCFVYSATAIATGIDLGGSISANCAARIRFVSTEWPDLPIFDPCQIYATKGVTLPR